jgi:hypothetical protein
MIISSVACITAQCCEGESSAAWNRDVKYLKVPANTAAACTGKQWALSEYCPSDTCNSFVCVDPSNNIDANKYYGQRCETADSISRWVQKPNSLKSTMLKVDGVCTISSSDGMPIMQVNSDGSIIKARSTPEPCCVGASIDTSNKNITEVNPPEGTAESCTGKNWSLLASCPLGQSCRRFWCFPCEQQVVCPVHGNFYGQVCAPDNRVWNIIDDKKPDDISNYYTDCELPPKKETSATATAATSDASSMNGIGGFTYVMLAAHASKVIFGKHHLC